MFARLILFAVLLGALLVEPSFQRESMLARVVAVLIAAAATVAVSVLWHLIHRPRRSRQQVQRGYGPWGGGY